jgi:hypothetical protein
MCLYGINYLYRSEFKIVCVTNKNKCGEGVQVFCLMWNYNPENKDQEWPVVFALVC